MMDVLHTEQVYEYYEPLPLDTPLEIVTRVESERERRGMRFISLHTDIRAKGKLCVTALSSFVVQARGDRQT
jgi:hypothetical protein